jgi:DHA3 family macrolide efflux protein-like MFS transporter
MTVLFPVVNSSSQAIWMSKTPNEMQGRVFAARRVIASLISPIALGMAGPLADKVFEPAMQANGAWATTLGRVFGIGDGAGIRVLFVLMGALSTAVAVIWLARPHIRHVETELPDAIDATPQEPHLHKPPTSMVEAVEELEGAFLEP